MTNDTMFGSLYLLMAMMLVLGGLISRREPLARMAVMALSWIAIFALGFVIFAFRDDLGYLAQRLRAEATGTPVAVGRTIRIPMAVDGHFWVEGRINGRPARFLVDSGASMTTIDRDAAEAAGVHINPDRDQVVRTGNGFIQVSSGWADSLVVGDIERRDIRLHVADNDDMNVLGMNFLSSLRRWSVEGRWLVLET